MHDALIYHIKLCKSDNFKYFAWYEWVLYSQSIKTLNSRHQNAVSVNNKNPAIKTISGEKSIFPYDKWHSWQFCRQTHSRCSQPIWKCVIDVLESRCVHSTQSSHPLDSRSRNKYQLNLATIVHIMGKSNVRLKFQLWGAVEGDDGCCGGSVEGCADARRRRPCERRGAHPLAHSHLTLGMWCPRTRLGLPPWISWCTRRTRWAWRRVCLYLLLDLASLAGIRLLIAARTLCAAVCLTLLWVHLS